MKLSEILKKEYVKTAILLAVVVVSVFAFWIGLTTALRTEYPMLAVASGSMEPTLYKGDLIMVQGVSNGYDIKVGPKDSAEPGDVIVFQTSHPEPIIHRVVKISEEDNKVYFQTKGDHNAGSGTQELRVSEDTVYGKAWLRIPWLGYVKIWFVNIINIFR